MSVLDRALAALGLPRPATRAIRPGGWTGYGHGSGYGLMHGGIVNPATGMGGAGDKSESAFFAPTRLQSRHQLEVLYVQSWACRKFIGIPVDDMLIRWRSWESTEDPGAAEAMVATELRHRVRSRLGRAMKAGRLFGTGLLVMVTREDDLASPLSVERVREGDLRNLLVFDRYAASVLERDSDPMSPTYGEAVVYGIAALEGRWMAVHQSRVLRFDGISPLGTDGYTIYDRDWGVSEIVSAILAILQDQSTATGAAHLAQEASIPVMHIDGFREALTGAGPDDPSPEQIGERINSLKSIYRTLMMDKADDFERVAVSWAGLHDVMDQFARRLAACADIPMTRFWGQSPVGLNATGESDLANYAHLVAAMQQRQLTEPLTRLDQVLARDAGLAEPPEYEWVPLTDLGDADRAAVARAKADAIQIAISSGVIDEDEGRMALDGDPVFGALPGAAPELPEPAPPPIDDPSSAMMDDEDA